MSSLLRSTKFVRYFTGAARTLILNSAKTAESNLLNPKALCATNNAVVRDYASKKTENLEPLLQKLDLEVRRFGRITKRDIDEVFDELRSKNDITSSQSLLVIRCCGELVPEELPEQRTLLVQKIWGVLTERGIPMDISHYNALLRVYLENEHPFSPAQFLEELETKGLQPNRVTYQRLMWRYCQEGDVEGATKVLEKMRELNLPVSEPVLNALVMGHAFHGDTEGAKAVLQTMAGAGLEPTNRTYTLLACGYAKLGDIEGVENVIKMATNTDSYMTDKDILEIIEHLAVGGHGDKTEQLFHHLHKGPGYNQDAMNLMLRLLNKGHEDVAKKVMKTMPKAEGKEDTPFKGAFFIKQLLRLKKSPDDIIRSCKELTEEGLVPKALFIATDAALQQANMELAEKLFKEMQNNGMEIRQHYYWPLLVQKGKEGDEEGLLQIIRNMVTQGLSPSGEALRDYIIPYMIGKDTDENIILKLQIAGVPVIHSARNLMVELLERGLINKAADVAVRYRLRGQYNLISRSLLNALSKTKDIESFTSILHVMSSSPPVSQTDELDEVQSSDESQEVGRIVKSGVKILGRESAEALLKAVHAKGLRISTTAAEGIQQYLGENLSTNLSELLLQLTSADLEPTSIESPSRSDASYQNRNSAQLEKLIEQAKAKGGNNINRLQSQLLAAYIREDKVEKVDSLLSELKASNYDLSITKLTQLYEFYCQHDEIEKAKECAAQISAKDPAFQLNKFKLIHMAYALVRANQIDEAIEFLKQNKLRDEDENKSFMYNSKCWQMLNHLAEAKDDVKLKEMTKILIENNYIEPSNVILGPSIKVHLLKGDIEAALKEFEYCCKNYRTTPWKGELMKALILKEDATKLQWLADLSTQIHGEVNILHDLVLAFVECGRLRQARRILETPGLHTRQRRLEDACQRYVEEGKSEYLEGLLEATKELNHIDRSNIFHHLLVTYCKADETDKALGLWTVLQEEGEIPSEQFLLHLGKYLQSKNRPVPFVMPEEAVDQTQKEKPKDKETQKNIVQTQRKIVTPKRPGQPTKQQISDKIEEMIKNGQSPQAMDFAIKSIEGGVMPKPTVLKFLLKNLAEEGNVEKIQNLGKYLSENWRKDVTYEDKLTLAIFKRGAGAHHIDSLHEVVKAAHTDDALQTAIKKYPRSNALASIMDNEELLEKCRNVAVTSASRGEHMPANLLWMEYLLAGKDQEAESIWNQCLATSKTLVFRRLLQESHVRQQPELMEKLIAALKSNANISIGSIGNAYSRLINLHLIMSKPDKALKAYEEAVKCGVKKEHFNKNCIERLETVARAEGLEFKAI